MRDTILLLLFFPIMTIARRAREELRTAEIVGDAPNSLRRRDQHVAEVVDDPHGLLPAPPLPRFVDDPVEREELSPVPWRRR